jgi:hypothetical protein
VVFGIVGFVKGDGGPGIAAMIVGVIGLVVGVVLLSVMNRT